MIYLDHNAITPVRPEALEAVRQGLEAFGNPSSVHAAGRAARDLLDRARGQVARALGAAPGEVVFTSGATEAAALAMRGALSAGPDGSGRDKSILGGPGQKGGLHGCSRSFEPRVFGEARFVVADPDAPPVTLEQPGGVFVSNSEWLDYVAAGIAHARTEGGRVLVLTTSYSDAAALGERCAVGHRSPTRVRSSPASSRPIRRIPRPFSSPPPDGPAWISPSWWIIL